MVGINPVQKMRRLWGVSQFELAGMAHVTQQAVSQWERGLSEPRLSHLRAIRNQALRQKLPYDDDLFFGKKPAPRKRSAPEA